MKECFDNLQPGDILICHADEDGRLPKCDRDLATRRIEYAVRSIYEPESKTYAIRCSIKTSFSIDVRMDYRWFYNIVWRVRKV